ncbi:hypothetical protein CC2G_005002 [Coprinopsis cinerea AmutBmut pab1-1]|nr:hypothetical protein CC2G_005002 [Coprinopsis cinerea AmutBmut pab1-1]
MRKPTRSTATPPHASKKEFAGSLQSSVKHRIYEALIDLPFNILSGLGLVDGFSAADINGLEGRDLTGLSRGLPFEERQICPTHRLLRPDTRENGQTEPPKRS